jgi:two-component system, OmpR family, phosphate regulon sensor histidine kinase PhoR
MAEDGHNPSHYDRRILAALIASGLTVGVSMSSGYLALIAVATAIVGFCAGRISRFSSAAPAVVADSIESIPQQSNWDEALLLAEILDAVDLPTLAIGADGIVLIVNSLAGHLLPSLVPGVPLAFGIRDPDVLNALEKTHESGIRQMVEWSEPAHLRRTFRIRIAPLIYSNPSASKGQIEIMTLEDLSEQRVIERTRVDFVANASHELRTPLAAMLGFIETLQGPARNDSDARDRFLAIMREQGLRMSRLIDDLLSLSRIEQRAHQAPAELVDLSLVVREIVDTLTLVAHERGVILVIKSAGANVTTRGDRDELLRLAENLIENAIKYGGSGGRVEINVHAEDGEATLTVRDYGPGIAPEHIPRLTERFYRVDVGKSRNSGGTGLGLALVKHIVLRHRGSLFIESPAGGGALFRAVFRHFTP